jgi:MFS family permease
MAFHCRCVSPDGNTSQATPILITRSAFGLTSYTVGIPEVMAELNVSMPVAILGMSLYVFGIFFAPIHTPHWSERFGRKPVYIVSLSLCMLFILGAGRSKTWGALAACRFFAGFFGGPCLVLIEGTFADVWSAAATNTYYAFLASAANVGAGLGGFRHILTIFSMLISCARSSHSRLRCPGHLVALDPVCQSHAHARGLPIRHRHA